MLIPEKIKFLSFALLIEPLLFAGSYIVTTTEDSTSTVPSGSLREAMLNAFFDGDSSITIVFQNNLGTITLVDHLPVLSSYQSPSVNFIVDGGVGNSIDGNGLYQAFFISPTHNNGAIATGTITATISNLTFVNCSVTGGNGQDGGGGGMGAGGAIFVDNNAMVIGSSLTFSNCSALGGDSQINISTKSGGGGGGARGGLGGAAHASDNLTSHGAGGGGGFASSGGSATATISTIEGGGGGAPISFPAKDFPVMVEITTPLRGSLLQGEAEPWEGMDKMLPQEGAVEVALSMVVLWEEMEAVERAAQRRLKQAVMELEAAAADKAVDLEALEDSQEAVVEQVSQQEVRATILQGAVEV